MPPTSMSHADGVARPAELLFETPFDYLFPVAARTAGCLVEQTDETNDRLNALADAMADPGTPTDLVPSLDSSIPAIFTYFGQFIDHDITAQTDRDGAVSKLVPGPVAPAAPDAIVAGLRNGRRPLLDLESVYGDGPALAPGATSAAQDFGLYTTTLKLAAFRDASGIDLPRRPADDGTAVAIIADMRNDENINVSQIHAAFLAFHNQVHDHLPGTPAERYVRARQLARWCYQRAVVHDYLPAVCDPNVVNDVKVNGPRYLGPASGRTLFMPLEFSVAGFRFGHSMIRPSYKLNAQTTLPIDQIFFPGKDAQALSSGQLKADRRLDFHNYIGPVAQRARRIDPRLALGLANLFGSTDPVLKHLARRNLLRAYSLSIPTGQAVAQGLGLKPLTAAQLTPDDDAKLKSAVSQGSLATRTPLWYYVLREAALQQGGARLGEVGSRIVAETLIGLLVQDPGSYLNQKADPAIGPNGITIQGANGGTVTVSGLVDILKVAGVL